MSIFQVAAGAMQHKFSLLLDSPHKIVYYGYGLWSAFIKAWWHGVPSLLQSQKHENLFHWSPVTTTCRKCGVGKDLERSVDSKGDYSTVVGMKGSLEKQLVRYTGHWQRNLETSDQRRTGLWYPCRYSLQGKAALDLIFSGFSCTSGKKEREKVQIHF